MTNLSIDLSNVARRLEPSVMIVDARQKLLARFADQTPLTFQQLANAVRSAVSIYGIATRTENLMTAESFAMATQYVQTEINAVSWIINNPRFAQSIAVDVLTR